MQGFFIAENRSLNYLQRATCFIYGKIDAIVKGARVRVFLSGKSSLFPFINRKSRSATPNPRKAVLLNKNNVLRFIYATAFKKQSLARSS